MAGARWFLGSRCHRCRRVAARARGESGFALIEVIVAFSVLLLALLGIGLEMGTQYSSIGSSHSEQTGQAVLSRLLDEARALPYTVVAKGLSTADSTATSTSTYIKKSGTGTSVWTLKDSALASGKGTGEVINHYAPPTGLTPPAPFYKHKACFSSKGFSVTCTGGQLYTALTFSTKYGSKVVTGVTKTWVNHVVRITVLVSWRGGSTTANLGTPTTLTGQTLIFAKTVACTSLGLLTTPNPASCQPNFEATARAGNGIIAVKPAAGVTTPITGLTFTSFDLVLPGTSSSQTLTETSTVIGTAKTSGGTTAPTSSLDQGVLVISKATNDLATGTSDDQTVTLTQTATALTSTSSTTKYSITATPSASDTGTSVSTTSASTAHVCKNFTGTKVTTALPCGAGRAAQGTTTTLGATLGSAGAVTLASVAATPTHPDRVLIERFARNASVTCPTTSKSGCVNSSARGGLGTVKLAGLPAALTAPAGWSGYLVKVSSFRARATTWARSASTWLSGSMTTVTGTVSYYNGSGYSSFTVGTSAQTVPSTTVTVTTGAISVKMTPHLVVGGAACSLTTTSSHPGNSHLEQCSVSPLSGTITYVVTITGVTVADFTMTVGLGILSATASYQVAS